MWRNPNHPAPAPPTPAEPSGQQIAAFQRPGRGNDPDAELRVDLTEYMGNPFISLRVWTKGNDGQWYPSRKGVSVRLGEAEELAEALGQAVRQADFAPARLPSRPPQRQAQQPRRPGPVPEPQANPPAAVVGDYDQAFDEFSG